MKRSMVRLAFVLAVAFAGSGGPAAAIGEANDMVGRWTGVVQGVSDPDIDVAFLDISSAKSRRFQGEIHGVSDPEIKVEGTLSAGGILSLEGGAGNGGRLVVHGKVRSIGDPEIVGDPQIRVAALSFEVLDQRGRSRDSGRLLLMQMMGGAAWGNTPGASITGPWAGDAPSEANRYSLLQLSLANVFDPLKRRTTSLVGTADFRGLPLPGREGLFDVTLDVRGTVGDSGDSTPQLGLIGSDAVSGTVAILTGVVSPNDEPPGIRGSYVVFDDIVDAVDWASGDDSPVLGGEVIIFFEGGVTYALVTDIEGANFGSTLAGTITFPWSSIGATGFDIADAVSFDFHVEGWSNSTFSSDDPEVTYSTIASSGNQMEFGVGAVGDPILRPLFDEDVWAIWTFNKGEYPDLEIFVLWLLSGDGNGWLWTGAFFNQLIDEWADPVSQEQTAWHLERLPY